MQITWYGHSAFRLDFTGQAVLIDPFFTGNPRLASDLGDTDICSGMALDAVIPCHYGSFPIIEANADKFAVAMKGHQGHRAGKGQGDWGLGFGVGRSRNAACFNDHRHRADARHVTAG